MNLQVTLSDTNANNDNPEALRRVGEFSLLRS